VLPPEAPPPFPAEVEPAVVVVPPVAPDPPDAPAPSLFESPPQPGMPVEASTPQNTTPSTRFTSSLLAQSTSSCTSTKLSPSPL